MNGIRVHQTQSEEIIVHIGQYYAGNKIVEFLMDK